MHEKLAQEDWQAQLKADLALLDLEQNPVEVIEPTAQKLPLVMSSPHSGALYPHSFIESTVLDGHALRRSEDSFMDQVARASVGLGVPMVAARFPRVLLDPNREPYELDPRMFHGAAPSYVKDSPRVKGGLGTIARIVGSGQPIYGQKLSYMEAEWRIDHLYRPYHATLQRLLDQTVARFGFAILIDWHSMPSAAVRRSAKAQDGTHGQPDLVLGDRFGQSCQRSVVKIVETAARQHRYFAVRNAPYAGGHITSHYGRPQRGLHALQIEVNRSIYMDEEGYAPTAGLERLVQFGEAVAEKLGTLSLRRAVDAPPLAAE